MATKRATQALRTDEQALIDGVVGRDPAAFEALMRAHNGRLFRVARSILKSDPDAEDALQDAYLDAFHHAAAFRGESSLATWLTRIVINHALMRLRRQRHQVVVPFAPAGGDRDDHDPVDRTGEPPPAAAFRAEVRRLIERRLDDLPVAFRTVFIMRDVNEMSVEDTAAALAIPAATVRTRLFRARARLREALARDIDSVTLDLFGFAGDRCDRIVSRVLARVAEGGEAGAAAPGAPDGQSGPGGDT
jgi:RNA polymerase sigma-70 factor (ECF subfamily)